MSRHTMSYVQCDECGEDDRGLDFTLGMSLTLPTGAKLDVCLDCKQSGVFACPDCKLIHNETRRTCPPTIRELSGSVDFGR